MMNIDDLLTEIGANEPVGQDEPDITALLAEINSLGTPEPTVEEDKLQEEMSSSDLTIGTARAFTEGMTLGWGDEAGLFLAALGAKASGAEESVGALYKDMKSLYDTEQAQFKEAAPGVALGAEVAGAIGSPASWVGLPAKGGSFLYNVARAGTEGAVYGAGAADEGGRLEGLQEGALYGVGGAAAVGVGLGIGGFGVNLATSRKIAEPLIDANGNFKPIPLAASTQNTTEELIGSVYRDVIGVIPGGRGALRNQVSDYVDPIKAARDVAEERVGALKNTIKQDTETLSTSLKDALKSTNSKIAEGKTAAKRLENAAKELPKGSAAAAKALHSVEKMKTDALKGFRELTFLDAFPVEGKREMAGRMNQAIREGNIYDAMTTLDKQWSQNGFSAFFNKLQIDTPINPESISKLVESKWDTDEGVQALFASAPELRGIVKNMVDGVIGTASDTGVIDGKALGTIYSRLGTRANAAEGPMKRGLYAAQETITDILENNLNPADFKNFKTERKKWKTLKVLRDSVETTASKLDKRGEFDLQDWVSAVKRNNVRDARQGSGPFFEKALALDSTLKSSEKAVLRRFTDEYSNIQNQVLNSVKAEQRIAQSQANKLQNEISALKKGKFGMDGAETIAQKTRELTITQQRAQSADELLKQYKALSPSKGTWFHQLAAMGVLGGGIIGGVSGGLLGGAAVAGGTAASAITAMGAAKALSSPTAQRIVAGQTAPQMAIQSGMQAAGEAGVPGAIQRAIGRVSGGMMSQ
jgi:hypothetical protein